MSRKMTFEADSRIEQRGRGKMNTSQQMELVKRIAWHWKQKKITDWIKEEYGLTLSVGIVQFYRESPKWRPIIEKFRDEYHRNLTEVPLANKRKRLDELEMLYEKAVDDGELVEARNLIKEFREEMERKVGEMNINFTQVTHNEFHEMSDEDLQEEKAKTIEKLEKVRKMKRLSQDLKPQGASDGQEETVEAEVTEVGETDEEKLHHE